MKKNILIVILLIISIGFNVYSVSKMGQMQQDISNLKFSITNVERTVDRIPSSVNASLNQFKKEQSWISPIKFDVVSVDKENIKLRGNWQIKDYKKGSKVFFNYNLDGNKKIDAINDGSGNFHIDLDISIDPEPTWANNIIRKGERKTSISEIEIKEEAKREIEESRQNKAFEFFISVEDEDSIKSSDKGTQSLRQFHNRLLGRLKSKVEFELKGDMNLLEEVDLIHFFDYGQSNKIKNVNIKIYDNNKLIVNSKLEKQRENIYEDNEFFTLSYRNDPIACTKIIMEVEYENGLKFTKEIYR